MFLTLLLLTAMAIFVVILIDDRWMGARGFAVFSGNGDGRIVDHAARQLVLGIIPYIVYGTFTEPLQSCTLISAGLVLLAVDFLARFGAQVVHVAHANAMPALYLCLVLTFLVFPVGAALGHLIAKFWPWETQ